MDLWKLVNKLWKPMVSFSLFQANRWWGAAHFFSIRIFPSASAIRRYPVRVLQTHRLNNSFCKRDENCHVSELAIFQHACTTLIQDFRDSS